MLSPTTRPAARTDERSGTSPEKPLLRRWVLRAPSRGSTWLGLQSPSAMRSRTPSPTTLCTGSGTMSAGGEAEMKELPEELACLACETSAQVVAAGPAASAPLMCRMTSPAPTRFVSVPDYDEEYNDCDDDDYDGTEYGINHPVNMGKVVYIYRKKGEPIKLVFTGKKKGITPVASFSALDKEGEDPTPSAAAEPKPSNDPAEDDISTL
ncbi:hypothetical protein ZEAMMB73_Zm00001d048686 [Zea mays]|uniref:Uncharacterized protein n=1 Tax=Zea mays TaxID=4577 RepID=A0A1D6PNI6_MAIZE|nr:hypothetical protein ZEAMMB73_Zm00001d048686 [Zea mays]